MESGGQLCARARFWASLRLDGELSELEGALLDAHLARCSECRAVAADFGGAATLLRSTTQEGVRPIAVATGRSPRRLLASVAVASLLLLGVLAGSLVRAQVSGHGTSTPHVVAVVANLETPDQLRRLRRTTLLNSRKLPRDMSAEPA